MAIQFDQDELDGLTDFLTYGFGRIAAAVVPHSAAGRELIDLLRGEFGPETVRVAEHLLDPVSLGEQAQSLAGNKSVFILPFDGRHRMRNDQTLLSKEDEADLWRRLNYQREKLATSDLRTLFVLDEWSDRFTVLAADDLRDWISFFRFPEAVLPLQDLAHSGRSSTSLETLRDQLRRAREAGLSETEVSRSYALPLYLALVEAGETDEALTVWREELRSRDRLRAEAVEAAPTTPPPTSAPDRPPPSTSPDSTTADPEDP